MRSWDFVGDRPVCFPLCIALLTLFVALWRVCIPATALAGPAGRAQSSLTLRTEPEGARVSLDGILLAERTPIAGMKLSPKKEISLVISLEGYETEVVAVAPAQLRRGLKITLKLTPLPEVEECAGAGGAAWRIRLEQGRIPAADLDRLRRCFIREGDWDGVMQAVGALLEQGEAGLYHYDLARAWYFGPAGGGAAGGGTAEKDPATNARAEKDPATSGHAGKDPATNGSAGKDPATNGNAGKDPVKNGRAVQEPATKEPDGRDPAGIDPAHRYARCVQEAGAALRIGPLTRCQRWSASYLRIVCLMHYEDLRYLPGRKPAGAPDHLEWAANLSNELSNARDLTLPEEERECLEEMTGKVRTLGLESATFAP